MVLPERVEVCHPDPGNEFRSLGGSNLLTAVQARRLPYGRLYRSTVQVAGKDAGYSWTVNSALSRHKQNVTAASFRRHS